MHVASALAWRASGATFTRADAQQCADGEELSVGTDVEARRIPRGGNQAGKASAHAGYVVHRDRIGAAERHEERAGIG